MQLARKTAAPASAPSRTRSVRVAASSQGANVAAKIAAGIAAGSLLVGPAFAGVVLEQPQLKKVFQADSTPAAAAAAKPAAKKQQKVAETSSGGIAPQAVALPAALVVVGGGAFALSSLDAGFADFMRTAAVKDSGADGAGYETDIKGGALAARPAKKAGTAKAKKGTGKGLFGK